LGITSQNGVIGGLYPYDEESLRSCGNTRWIIGVVTQTGMLIILGIFHAENAPVSARRYEYELSLQSVVNVLIYYAAQYLIRGRGVYSESRRGYLEVRRWECRRPSFDAVRA
jgi:hypothetical protein